MAVARGSVSSSGSSVPGPSARAVAPGLGPRFLAMILLLVAGATGASAPQHHGKPARPRFTVGQYVEVARRPVSHKSVQYTFVAHVTNHGAAESGVACTVRLACSERRYDHNHHDNDACDDDHGRVAAPVVEGPRHGHPAEGPVLLDDTLTFGTVGAGKTLRSLDTFRFRQEKKDRIELDRFLWSCTADTNHAPRANAGPDQTVVVTSRVTLDGTGSSDPDGDPLAFRWSFASRPAGSAAVLDDPAAVHPTFEVDRPGEYQVQLVVNDGKVDSPPDGIVVSTRNSSPVANAGPDQTVFVGSTVELDGSGSTDVDGDRLTFRWSLTSVPAGSAATLSDAAAVRSTFLVDVPGTFVAQLIVNDGQSDSPADTVEIAMGAFDPTFATGSAHQDATPDAEGCLGAGLVLATTTGVKATLAAGTCLREPLGAPVTGPVTIGIDDAGGTPAGSGLAGVVRLFVRTAVGESVPAALNPPAQLELPLAEPAPAGTWYTHVFVQGEYLAVQLPAESGPFISDAIVPVAGEPDRLELATATVLGIGFEPAPPAAARPSLAGVGARVQAAAVPHTVSLTLPSDPSMPDPRVFVWSLINPRTAQIVATGNSLLDGMGAGESQVRSRVGHLFTATLVQAGGQYRFEVTSDYANRFALRLLVGPDGNGPFTEVGPTDATGGCAEEACTDQIYAGDVVVDFRAPDLSGLVSMRDTVAARLPPGARIVWHTMRTLPSGAGTARLSIRGLETSTQLLPPILPTRWEKIAGDRTLSVDSSPLGVTIKQGTLQAGGGFDGTGIGWTIYDADENVICCLPIVLPADAPPPVTLGPAGRSLRAFEPSPNVLAINVTGAGFSDPHTDADSAGAMLVRAELSFRTPGTLQIDIDPAWLQNGAGRLRVIWTLDSGETAQCEGSGGNVTCVPGSSGAVPITQRGKRTVDVRAFIGGGGADQSSAGGRAVTLTFTPAP